MKSQYLLYNVIRLKLPTNICVVVYEVYVFNMTGRLFDPIESTKLDSSSRNAIFWNSRALHGINMNLYCT